MVGKNDIFTNKSDPCACNDWMLIDEGHPRYNVWKSMYGYCETFPKNVNPNNCNDICEFDDEKGRCN